MDGIKYSPAIFSVGTDYQIIVRTDCECIVSVTVNGKKYFDSSNGVIKSNSDVYKITVPMQELDNAEEYTLAVRKVIERLPYEPKFEEEMKETYSFIPVPKENVKSYMIADAHGMVDIAVEAVHHFEKKYGDIDFLIFNGDIHHFYDKKTNIDVLFQIAERITFGSKPIVFARGNHDLRGKYAEELEKYTPTHNGKPYYTVRLGNIWGIVLDSCEDKNDAHNEYNGTVCCRDFKLKETDFIKEVISKKEYETEEIRHKVVICHAPFTQKEKDIFDIDSDIYSEWGRLLKDYIKPDIMLCGHTHRIYTAEIGGKYDNYNQPCKLVVGSMVKYDEYFAGTGIIFKEEIETVFVGSDGLEISASE